MSLRTFMTHYPILSIMAVLWAMGIVTYATITVFSLMTSIDMSVAAIYGSLLAIPSVAFGFYSFTMNPRIKEIQEKVSSLKTIIEQNTPNH